MLVLEDSSRNAGWVTWILLLQQDVWLEVKYSSAKLRCETHIPVGIHIFEDVHLAS
jgi:hypothetical protein